MMKTPVIHLTPFEGGLYLVTHKNSIRKGEKNEQLYSGET